MSNFTEGWDDTEHENIGFASKRPNGFFIPVTENTPEEERSAKIVILDPTPVTIPLHHFCDPRMFNTKKQERGKWGNFHTCVTGNTKYAYCPACRAEKKFKVRSIRMVKSYLTVYSLKTWKDKTGKEHTQGKCLFGMTPSAKKTLLIRVLQPELKKNKSFSLVGAIIDCYRAEEKNETIGNDFRYNGHYDMEEFVKKYGKDSSTKYDYEEIFAPSSIEEMMDDYNAVCEESCGGNFFNIGPVTTNTTTPIRASRRFPAKTENTVTEAGAPEVTEDSTVETEQIPF